VLYSIIGIHSSEWFPVFKLIAGDEVMKLSELVKKERTVKPVLYDKDWKVSFKVAYLSRTELQSMIGRNTKIDFDPKTHEKVEKLNAEALSKEIADTCVLGWEGVTYKWLANVMPIDIPDSKDGEELEFSKENLETLLKNTYGIESWIFDTVKDAANFSEKKEAEAKN
jgi:hypothetical protein